MCPNFKNLVLCLMLYKQTPFLIAPRSDAEGMPRNVIGDVCTVHVSTFPEGWSVSTENICILCLIGVVIMQEMSGTSPSQVNQRNLIATSSMVGAEFRPARTGPRRVTVTTPAT